MRIRNFVLIPALLAAGCGSTAPERAPDDARPTAPPIDHQRNVEAKKTAVEVVPDPKSPSRVLGWVEGDVITYREVLQMAGPQIAALSSPDDATEREHIENQALLNLAIERLMYRAASDAMVTASRDEIETQRQDFVRRLARNGGTLDAFLHEHDMTRREFDEMVKRQLVVEKYQFAAIGRAGENVHVRPVTDTYVAPEDVQKYYDRHPDKYHEPPLARYRMLTIKADLEAPDRERAVAAAKVKTDDVVARLKRGEDWSPVYRQACPGTEADQVDGLVEIRRGEKADWIEEFAFKSKKGAVMDKQVGTTFFVLRAEGSHEERTVPFSEVEQDIRAKLMSARGNLAWLEVELSVLDHSSVQPDSLRAKLRESLRRARLEIVNDSGM